MRPCRWLLKVRQYLDDVSASYWRRLGDRGEDGHLNWRTLLAGAST